MSINIVFCLTLILLKQTSYGQHPSYHHYERQYNSQKTSYDNETLSQNDDDNSMCHLSVRCPNVASISPFDRDIRNRRFTVDSFLAMHGPTGPAGPVGPPGSPGPRGAVGAQGMPGRSKEAVPIIAFIAYLQKMLVVESNRSETIVFEDAQINDGKGYNPSTGVFTASHRGVYKFSITIMAQMDSIATVRIIHNREKVFGMVRCDCRRRFSHVRGNFYAELDVNDQVMVEALGDPNEPSQSAPRNNIYGYTYTHFSGALLFS